MNLNNILTKGVKFHKILWMTDLGYYLIIIEIMLYSIFKGKIFYLRCKNYLHKTNL